MTQAPEIPPERFKVSIPPGMINDDVVLAMVGGPAEFQSLQG